MKIANIDPEILNPNHTHEVNTQITEKINWY